MNLENKYKKIYNKLMEKAKNRELLDCFEVHHIIPKCMGGLNDRSNLVRLTAREHYLAHQLLIKIYPDNSKLIYAARMMTVISKNHPYRSQNRLYGWLREKHRNALSKRIVSLETRKKLSMINSDGRHVGEKNSQYGIRRFGEENPFFGKKHSPEIIELLRVKCSMPGNKNPFFGKKHKIKTKKNIGKKNSLSVKIKFLNGNEICFDSIVKFGIWFSKKTKFSCHLGQKLCKPNNLHLLEKYGIKEVIR